MRIPSIDISSMIWIPVVVFFWGFVGVQWIRKQQEIQSIKKTTVCQYCGNKEIDVEIDTVNQRTNHKVSILKIFGGAYLLFIPGFLLLRAFILYLSNLISGRNLTGIQDEELLGKVGSVSFPLLVGLSAAAIGFFLLLELFLGKKCKILKFSCNSCKMVNFLNASQT